MSNPTPLFTPCFDATSSFMFNHFGSKPRVEVPQNLTQLNEASTIHTLLSSEKVFVSDLKALLECLTAHKTDPKVIKSLKRVHLIHERLSDSLEPANLSKPKSRFSLSSFMKLRAGSVDSSHNPNDENIDAINVSPPPTEPKPAAGKENKAFLLRKSGSVEQLSQQRRRASLPESEERPGTTLLGEIISEDAEDAESSPKEPSSISLPNIAESNTEAFADLTLTMPSVAPPAMTAFELKKMGSVEQMSRKKHARPAPSSLLSTVNATEDAEAENEEEIEDEQEEPRDEPVADDESRETVEEPLPAPPQDPTPQSAKNPKLSIARSRAVNRAFARKFGSQAVNAHVAFVHELKAFVDTRPSAPALNAEMAQKPHDNRPNAEPLTFTDALAAPVLRIGAYIAVLEHLASVTASDKARGKYKQVAGSLGQLAEKMSAVIVSK
eukprot:c21190_g1_i1.p1 GENE.c21190_g1_i1~~c21190_g1_i1.p1  ORF type:complete len:439 (-),score=79.20 c21190_g1_i1:42-1358(-)